MRIILIFIILIVCSFCYGQTDTTKRRKNLVEVGITSATFFDGTGFKIGSTNGTGLIGRYNIGFARKISPYYWLGVSYLGYARAFPELIPGAGQYNNVEKGDLLGRYLRIVELEFARDIILSKTNHKKAMVNIRPSIGIGYKFLANERIYLGSYFPNDFDYASISLYNNSVFASLGCGINLELYNRFIVGLDNNLTYNFTVDEYTEQPPEFSENFSKKFSHFNFYFQPKLGVKF